MVLRAFFETEAGESLAALRIAATDEPPGIDRLVRFTRVLRGSALLAGEMRVHGAAAALADGLVTGPVPDASFRARVQTTIEDLDVLVAGSAADADLDALAGSVESRWGAATAPAPDPVAARPIGTDDFVAREVAAVADTMDAAVAAFQADPRDCEGLATVRRSLRALLGSVRIEATPVVAESLRALEELTVLIERLDVPVKAEWLDVFRSGRDVLRMAAAAIEEGQVPAPVPALSRLRTLREELVARYSTRHAEPSSAADDLDDPGP